MNKIKNTVFDFVEYSKVSKVNYNRLKKSISNFISSNNYSNFIKNGFTRVHSLSDTIELEDTILTVSNSEVKSLLQIFENRFSQRVYHEKIKKETLLNFFKIFSYKSNIQGANYSSAGALYPIEVFFISNNIKGVKNGIYLYDRDYKKIRLRKKVNKIEMKQILDNYFQAEDNVIDFYNSSVIFLLGNQWGRSVSKYDNRGYRFSLIEAGAVMQTIQLICSAMRLKTCANGGYFDDKLNELIGYNAAKQNVELTIVLGK